jgi:RES domain-containing protein
MTPEDRRLSPDIFFKGSITLYRLARIRYANLSGVGAAVAPGRWNRKGQEALYTATEVGVPLLERLAHTSKDLIPSNLAMMTIRIEGNWERLGNSLSDYSTGANFLLCPSLREARKLSLRRLVVPFALAVPSVIVPAWNVVLYPEAVGFWEHVKLVSVEPFEFDPRLFAEGAAIESEK